MNNTLNNQSIAVVVPVYNEAGNIAPLLNEVAALSTRLPLAEIIYVDDNSDDASFAQLQALSVDQPLLRVLRHSVRCGQSLALLTGIAAANSPLVAILDGDGQNDPADLAALYDVYAASPEKAVMVMGERAVRRDNALRRLSSRVANNVRGCLLKDGVRDTGCALKLFRRDDFLKIPAFNHMHRFMPALMQRQGVTVKLVPVSHRPRLHGKSKYGVLNRLVVGIVDIVGVMWLQRRAFPAQLKVEEHKQ